MVNHLADSLSPYLQQHAGNPVDWWPWGPAAFAEARRRDVPVFVSIGYAACHWCHVMAHESFEDAATARLLNEKFVAVKVDREEHPAVDAAYMRATTALTGYGGWPMSVWTDADARPFYAGTYFPAQPRPGLPSFTEVLAGIAEAWDRRREEIEAGAAALHAHLASVNATAPLAASDGFDLPGTASVAARRIAADFDPVNAGFGSAPKFPPSMVLDFLERYHRRTGDPRSGDVVADTCEAMARGGIYDQLAGGFARYSVDAAWVVPHFEKMLYDNALLLRVYADLATRTGSPFARRIAEETAAFLLRDLRTPEGAFAAALDADSLPEGVGLSLLAQPQAIEGAAYVWTQEQLDAVLGDEDGRWAADLLGVTLEGTFELGASTLQLRDDPDDFPRWWAVKAALLKARDRRPQPARDDKVVAAWNGLAIAALAQAGVQLARPEWIEAAAAAADVLLEVHLGDQLVRISRDGVAGTAPGVLEDYADVASGLMALHRATGEPQWRSVAQALLADARSRFIDGDEVYDSEDDPLLPRLVDTSDNAYPSGPSALAMALLDLADSGVVGQEALRSLAPRLLAGQRDLMVEHPRFAGHWLAALEKYLEPTDIVIAGNDDPPST